MAKPFSVPDPKDRSINEPSVIVNAKNVLGLFNQEHEPEEHKERIVDSVKEWYTDRMTQEGWYTVDFHGNQCVLTAKIQQAK